MCTVVWSMLLLLHIRCYSALARAAAAAVCNEQLLRAAKFVGVRDAANLASRSL